MFTVEEKAILMMKNIKLLMLLSACVVLASCATGYKKKSAWDGLGYTDEKVSDGVYEVTYLANALTPNQDALKYWHMRAKELCGSDSYQYDVKETIQANKNYRTGSVHNFPYVVGTVTCSTR